MKIRFETDAALEEDEILLRCRSLDEEAIRLQRKLAGLVGQGIRLQVTRGDTDYYLPVDEILFFETADGQVAVHTADAIYSSGMRLYELEDLLPGSFLRGSKSCILNTARIRSIRKNITGASDVEFAGSNKKVFVSRNYLKPLLNKLEEKRIGHE